MKSQLPVTLESQEPLNSVVAKCEGCGEAEESGAEMAQAVIQHELWIL